MSHTDSHPFQSFSGATTFCGTVAYYGPDQLPATFEDFFLYRTRTMFVQRSVSNRVLRIASIGFVSRVYDSLRWSCDGEEVGS